ncbi:MAG: CBS domain-containing protein [Candidatus Heimdallarchaeota archaeon]
MQVPEKKARDVMYTPVVSVSPQKTIAQIIDMMNMYSFSQLPVITDDGKIVGSITERTLLEVLGSQGSVDTNKTIDTIMEASFPQVPPETSFLELVTIFSRENPHAILVVDKEGVKGIICKTDLIKTIVYKNKPS